jgi:hypothetical protein
VKPDDPSLVLRNPRSGEYYTLDAVGTRVWQLCDGKRTVSEVAVIIGQEYDEAPEVIERDVLELAEELMGEALVVAAG